MLDFADAPSDHSFDRSMNGWCKLRAIAAKSAGRRKSKVILRGDLEGKTLSFSRHGPIE
jgi:hypothetical protein